MALLRARRERVVVETLVPSLVRSVRPLSPVKPV